MKECLSELNVGLPVEHEILPCLDGRKYAGESKNGVGTKWSRKFNLFLIGKNISVNRMVGILGSANYMTITNLESLGMESYSK